MLKISSKLTITKQLFLSGLTLLTTTAVLNISLVQSAGAQTSSIINVNNTKVAGGSTTPGATNWQPYNGTIAGVFVDVNTSGAGFTATPNYITSIAGNSNHWETTGASAVYFPTARGFRVYVRFYDGRPLTPAFANQNQWRINWMGIGR